MRSILACCCRSSKGHRAVETGFEGAGLRLAEVQGVANERGQEIGGHGPSEAASRLVDFAAFKTGTARADLDKIAEGPARIEQKAGGASDPVASRRHRQCCSHQASR
jgi:hypothetical protein